MTFTKVALALAFLMNGSCVSIYDPSQMGDAPGMGFC